MNADTITAAAATAIALGSLWVSYTQTRSTRLHNRQSVRPLLVMRRVRGWEERKVGLQVTNAGLGPAVVTRTTVRLDGQDIGHWNRPVQHRVKDPLPVRPMSYSLRPGDVVLAGQSVYLLHIDEEFDGTVHGDFWELITRRLEIEIRYESLYGGENFRVRPPAW
ncbi:MULTISPECIES: hypothetical protein [Streptomyces]|uniref:Uncharacterized protein n=1 Tax=Streptomyces lycii TaxID=2654337 RepID=A0ABQ7FC49_9ACTN|nr:MULTISPECIES: hypothetical protein [Streptomyces]KAF4406666.1 hypothetical protein GCU69_23890 [Streptomyces lycii]PGH48783.1 hypothetical protein CRI70_21280 [Streptomyces sp. Ru87]